jgi:hypothetical protein
MHGFQSSMRYRGQIDRTKHEVDVAERVLEGGVWAGVGDYDRTRIVNLDTGVQVWPLGRVASAVRVQTIPPDPDER